MAPEENSTYYLCPKKSMDIKSQLVILDCMDLFRIIAVKKDPEFPQEQSFHIRMSWRIDENLLRQDSRSLLVENDVNIVNFKRFTKVQSRRRLPEIITVSAGPYSSGRGAQKEKQMFRSRLFKQI